MSKATYPTKYQLEHLKKRINNEIDPLIDQARLSVKSIIADLTESAELKLAKKIKADVVIKELEKAIQELEIKQRKAQTFFGKISNKELKQKLSYKFDKKDRDSYYRSSSYDRGITPEDCRDQIREWAQFLAAKEAEKQRIEAKGKADANRILAASLTPNVLRDKGIEATIKLAESSNSKVVVIGSGDDGLPLILGNN